MTLATPDENKEIYRQYHDEIIAKRFHSPSAIRRYAHRTQYGIYLDLIPAGATVLDAGCGEGVLSVMLAKKGCIVTGVDLSEPNIRAAEMYAREQGVEGRTTFQTGDIEQLAFPDRSFDYVVSNHVLEHVPDFLAGARELGRIARNEVIIAIPTCLNLAAMALLGGDTYWTLSRKSVLAIPKGFARVIRSLFSGEEGVNEGYAGNMKLIHLRRFPWRARKSLEQGGLTVKRYRGSSYVFPYAPFLLPVSRLVETFAWLPIVRECGFGVTFVCVPSRSSP